ncbi:uncharacterized protein METZ01_LOCUS219597, partial [marine metagenome]
MSKPLKYFIIVFISVLLAVCIFIGSILTIV